jgi:ubiquinone/menaquinone biosynthesis C-methylase UbiE
MDGENISFAEFDHCLQTLEKINVLTLAYRPILKWMRGILCSHHDKPLYILDAGSGGGDMLRRIFKLAKKYKRPLRLVGVDLNPWSKDSAILATPDAATIQYETANIFSLNTDDHPDIIVSSLFTHHLTDEQIIQFLKWMDRTAQRGWFINDLHRHIVPYVFIKYAVRLFSNNRLIQNDAPVSVARAFTADDWKRLISQSGISSDHIHIKWFFPFRYCVSCRKS